jgi:hypothetical protein
MTTFDSQQVRNLAADLNAQLDRCDNREGIECYKVDVALDEYAQCCCRFAEALRQWGRDVFAGRVAFDPNAEQLWKAELLQLCSRAMTMLSLGRQAESICFELEGQTKLKAALWSLSRLHAGWVTPALAVGPSARTDPFSDDALGNFARERIASLVPLQEEQPRLY